MENLREKYIELLQKKLDALNYMRDVTAAQVFTGEEAHAEAEAEAFVALYGRRSNVLARVEKIDDALDLLDPLDAGDLEDTDFQAQVVDFRQKMVELAGEMVRLDKANMEVYKKISDFVKSNLKQARQSMDLIQGYDDYLDANEGYFVDKKKV